MTLNDEQRKLVAENHNLIYWYASTFWVDLEEWYGALAIELCKTVMQFNPDKGSLSNYYKIRADNMMNKERAKLNSKKRTNNGVISIHELYDSNLAEPIDDFDESSLFRFDKFGILKLKSEGYTQLEIGDKLGMTQSQVSKLISGIRESYLTGKGVKHDR